MMLLLLSVTHSLRLVILLNPLNNLHTSAIIIPTYQLGTLELGEVKILAR